jgi:hypothetical protein
MILADGGGLEKVFTWDDLVFLAMSLASAYLYASRWSGVPFEFLSNLVDLIKELTVLYQNWSLAHSLVSAVQECTFITAEGSG